MKRIGFLIFTTLFAMARANAADALQPVADAARTANQWKDKAISYLIEHGPALLGAFGILVVGWMIGSTLRKFLDHKLQKREMEPPVRILLGRVLHLLVLILALIIALETVGFKMTTLIAAISVGGLGVGLAMQGMLGNLVAGLVIIFTKPFRVGEYIEIIGVHGQVETIELFNTFLLHADRSKVIVPNRKIIGEILHNYGTVRQLSLTVRVNYHTNVSEAVAIVHEILRENKRVLKDPTPGVGVGLLSDYSINISVSPWVKVPDYGAAQGEIYQAILEAFRARKIDIPLPQREVRLVESGDHPAGVEALKR